MKNRLYRKILAVGIIVLFIGVSVSSGFAVVNLEEKDTKNNSSIILDYSVFNVDTSTDKILNFEFIISNTTDDPASKNFKVYTYPYEEDLSYYLDDDKIDVSFTPSREGVYSVIVEAEDENNIVEKSISYYIVNPKGEGIVRYFF